MKRVVIKLANFFLDGQNPSILYLELKLNNEANIGKTILSESNFKWQSDDGEFGCEVAFLMNQESKDDWDYLKEQLESSSVGWFGNFGMRDFLKITEIGFLYKHRSLGVPEEIIEKGMLDFIKGDGAELINNILSADKDYDKKLPKRLNEHLNVACSPVKDSQDDRLVLSKSDKQYLEQLPARYSMPASMKESTKISLMTDEIAHKYLSQDELFSKIFEDEEEKSLRVDF